MKLLYPRGGHGPDWGKLFYKLWKSPPHLPPWEAAELTLPQLRILGNEGVLPRPQRSRPRPGYGDR